MLRDQAFLASFLFVNGSEEGLDGIDFRTFDVGFAALLANPSWHSI